MMSPRPTKGYGARRPLGDDFGGAWVRRDHELWI